MSPPDLWHWFSSATGLMAVFAHNRLLGACLIAVIIFVETGLVVVPFLPGDSLLFGAGAYLGVSGRSTLSLIVIAALAAIAGDALNYSVGRSRIGQSLVRRGWAKPRYLDRTRSYFARHGAMTITIARFVPIIRTVAPFLAGLSEMNPQRFFAYNVAGGILWCASMVSAGFWLGRVRWVHKHLQWLSLIIVAVSLVPRRFAVASGKAEDELGDCANPRLRPWFATKSAPMASSSESPTLARSVGARRPLALFRTGLRNPGDHDRRLSARSPESRRSTRRVRLDDNSEAPYAA